MKKIILKLIRRYANDRDFRVSVCKELHYNSQNYFGEQTPYGRYYEACGEFFEASPKFTIPFCLGGVIAEYKSTVEYLNNEKK